MAKVDKMPSQKELKKRREPKYIVDINQVTKKEDRRARQWAAAMMKKYESKLSYKFKDRQIIARGIIDAEDVDINVIYPFKNLNWIIYRNKMNFDIMLLSGSKILLVSSFAKI